MIEPLGNTPIHIILRSRLSSKWRIRAMGELRTSSRHTAGNIMIYADDTHQIYLCFNSQDMASTISRIEKCIADMRSWMVINKSSIKMLNDSKTEILHLTSRFVETNELLPVRIGDTEVTSSSHVCDLGVIIDKNMTMSQHVSNICRNASFDLHNIGKLRAYLDQSSTEKLVHAFVSSRLLFKKNVLLHYYFI